MGVFLCSAVPAQGAQAIAVSVELELLPGVDVVAPAGESGAPGDTLYYLFRVQNTGNLTTSYALRVSTPSGWKSTLPLHSNSKINLLAPGAMETVPVAVTIASNATVGELGDTTLTATADEKPRPSDSATVTTTVIAAPTPPEMVVAPPGQSGVPGQTIIYPFEVRNTGVVEAVFRLRVSSSLKWTTSLPNHPTGRVGPLAPGASETVPVAVEISSKAAVGDACETTLQVTRLGQPRLQDEASVTTIVVAATGFSLTPGAPSRQEEGTTLLPFTISNLSDTTREVLVRGRSLRGSQVTIAGQVSVTVVLSQGEANTFAAEVRHGGTSNDVVILSAEAVGGGSGRVQLALGLDRGS